MLETAAKTDAAPFTLLNRLQSVLNTSNHDDKEEEEDDSKNNKLAKIDHLDIAAEVLDHMVAGIDTTGDALCFLMWELSQPRSLGYQTKLQKELLSSPPNLSFDKLPYLDAIVMEGLRCFPAIPMSLPRIVPRGGGKTIDGYFLPEGTTVSCQAHSVHRIDKEAWGPDPDVFRPERWLEEGKEERKRLFFAFANGGRGCVGKQ